MSQRPKWTRDTGAGSREDSKYHFHAQNKENSPRGRIGDAYLNSICQRTTDISVTQLATIVFNIKIFLWSACDFDPDLLSAEVYLLRLYKPFVQLNCKHTYSERLKLILPVADFFFALCRVVCSEFAYVLHFSNKMVVGGSSNFALHACYKKANVEKSSGSLTRKASVLKLWSK